MPEVRCSLCGKVLPARRSVSRHGGWVVRRHRKLGETAMCEGHRRTDHEEVGDA